MAEVIDTVEKFKAGVKELIKACKFQEGMAFVAANKDKECFADLSFREKVTFVHWFTKAYLEAQCLTVLLSTCLDKVDSLLEDVNNTDGSNITPEDELELDQCRAELLYLKRSILCAAMIVDAEKPL